MRSIVLFGIVALVVAQAFYIVSGLRRNINKVKSSGLPYIIARMLAPSHIPPRSLPHSLTLSQLARHGSYRGRLRINCGSPSSSCCRKSTGRPGCRP